MKIEAFTREYALVELERQPDAPTNEWRFAVMPRKVLENEVLRKWEYEDKMLGTVMIRRTGTKYVGIIQTQTLNMRADTSTVQVEYSTLSDTKLALTMALAAIC